MEKVETGLHPDEHCPAMKKPNRERFGLMSLLGDCASKGEPSYPGNIMPRIVK